LGAVSHFLKAEIDKMKKREDKIQNTKSEFSRDLLYQCLPSLARKKKCTSTSWKRQFYCADCGLIGGNEAGSCVYTEPVG
jgi:hypothetical protein